MNWFITKIVFQIITGDGNHQPQFDEQLRLINADNWQQALEKAKALGQGQQEYFLNQKQELVRWQFINVAELSAIGKLEDGCELHYRITEPGNAEKYINFIHKKASDIACVDFAHFS